MESNQTKSDQKLNFKDIELDDLPNMNERAEVLSPYEIADLSNKIFARKSKDSF